jgi:hypothetical protein
MTDKATTPALTIVPADEASWEELQAVLGTRSDPSRRYCQRDKMQPGGGLGLVHRRGTRPPDARADRL